MKKVGILSMQRIANYGSFLQAFGLKSLLEELGCDVQFVDYHPGECIIKVNNSKGILRKLDKVLDAFKLHAPISEKIKYLLYKKNYSKNYYPLLGINEHYNYSPKLDLLVIGSDEVFNCVQDNVNVGFSPELFGKDNRANSVVSYAASFGNTTLEKLEKYKLRELLEDYFESFDEISVRDENSGHIIRELIGLEPNYHLDPVLIYDFVNKYGNSSIDLKEKYMILYGYTGRFSSEECNIIRKYANRKGLKIYCIGGLQHCCDKYIDCTPFDVVAYFKNADCVITDTFHGSILSIITHQKFATIIRNKGYGNSEKLTYLLKKLNLENRIVNDLTYVDELFETKIDYTVTDKIIVEERIKSTNYLKRNIENC